MSAKKKPEPATKRDLPTLPTTAMRRQAIAAADVKQAESDAKDVCEWIERIAKRVQSELQDNPRATAVVIETDDLPNEAVRAGIQKWLRPYVGYTVSYHEKDDATAAFLGRHHRDFAHVKWPPIE